MNQNWNFLWDGLEGYGAGSGRVRRTKNHGRGKVFFWSNRIFRPYMTVGLRRPDSEI